MKKRQSLFKIYCWIGLIAALWLFLLGITGILLDHDEWISDLFTIMGIIMVITGPILWLRRKW